MLERPELALKRLRDRSNMEKNCKMTQALLLRQTKLDEIARALNEADTTKKKLAVESQDLNKTD